MGPLINILIRTHRPKSLFTCLESIKNDTYPNKRVHLYDGTGHGKDYEYNLLCNYLKAEVKQGWIMYLDDDDVLINGSLQEISEFLSDEDVLVICQMMRGNNKKPPDTLMEVKQIWRGYIGMPCFFVHSKHKDKASFVARVDADYRFIKELSEKLKTIFISIPVVSSPKRNFGK